jgi:hypothetical protein
MPKPNVEQTRELIISTLPNTSAIISRNTKLETTEYDAAKLAAEVEKLRTEVDQAKQNLAERKSYAQKIFVMICLWLVAILSIVILTGFSAWGLKLSDSVIIALITSTTLNVAGFFLAVAKYLFPSKPE